VDNVFEIANNRISTLKLLGYARSAIRHNMAEDLPNLTIPVCLIWGEHDKVTPPKVAHEFHSLLPNSELHWVPLCGHAPMWEHPKEFSKIVLQWLKAKF
jgi:2-hydroxy-6-oxonona-2,4-dienedioate hydrolase